MGVRAEYEVRGGRIRGVGDMQSVRGVEQAVWCMRRGRGPLAQRRDVDVEGVVYA